jgi:hypothetical protein
MLFNNIMSSITQCATKVTQEWGEPMDSDTVNILVKVFQVHLDVYNGNLSEKEAAGRLARVDKLLARRCT